MREVAVNNAELVAEKRDVAEGLLNVNARLPYVAPSLIEVGRVRSLTFGVSGNGADAAVFEDPLFP